MKTSLKLALLAGAIAGIGQVAQAVPTLLITDGTTTYLISDGSAMDSSSVAGEVQFNGTIGNWTINADTGLTAPAIGSASQPILDLSFTAYTATGGTLWIEFSQTGFTGVGGANLSIGGTTDGALATSAEGGNSNTLFDLSNRLIKLPPSGFISGQSFSMSGAGSTVGAGPYSLTEYLVIGQTGAGLTTGDVKLTVPDSGTTLLLLGAGLSVLGFAGSIRRRFIK